MDMDLQSHNKNDMKCEIHPNLPLPKGGLVRQAHHDTCHPELVEGWQRGDRGDFLIDGNSMLRPLITMRQRAIFFYG